MKNKHLIEGIVGELYGIELLDFHNRNHLADGANPARLGRTRIAMFDAANKAAIKAALAAQQEG